MANTIWKEVFLIMCSSSRKNARNTERFSLTLRITDNYTLQILCGAPHNVGNEEAKLIGMEGNRYLDDGHSIIAGPFFVCGLTEDDFRGLTEEEVQKYMNKYAEPENISQEEVEADTGFMLYPM